MVRDRQHNPDPNENGRSIMVVPGVELNQKARVRAARKKVNAKYSKAFKKLAE